MLSENQFRAAIKNLHKPVYSKTGRASYKNFNLGGNTLSFVRTNTGQSWKLDIELLYHIYRTNSFINTSVVKRIGKGRVNSPSVAILMAIGCLDPKGNRIA